MLNTNQSTSANGKQALSAVLGSVTTAAQSIGGIFATIGAGVGMVNRSVQTAAEKQEIATDYEMADFEDNLHTTATIARATQKIEINRFLDASPQNRAIFQSTYDDLAAAVAERRARRTGMVLSADPMAALKAAAESAPITQPMPKAE